MTDAEGPQILEPVHAADDEADGKRWSYRLVVFLRVMAEEQMRSSADRRDYFHFVSATTVSNRIWRLPKLRVSPAQCCRCLASQSTSITHPTFGNSSNDPAKPAPSASLASGIFATFRWPRTNKPCPSSG